MTGRFAAYLHGESRRRCCRRASTLVLPPQRRSCMHRLPRLRLLQGFHWPQWPCIEQASIRIAMEMDVCDEKRLGCDGLLCAGRERGATEKRRDRSEEKNPTISINSENHLNSVWLSITWDGRGFTGTNLTGAVTNGGFAIRDSCWRGSSPIEIGIVHAERLNHRLDYTGRQDFHRIGGRIIVHRDAASTLKAMSW